MKFQKKNTQQPAQWALGVMMISVIDVNDISSKIVMPILTLMVIIYEIDDNPWQNYKLVRLS